MIISSDNISVRCIYEEDRRNVFIHTVVRQFTVWMIFLLLHSKILYDNEVAFALVVTEVMLIQLLSVRLLLLLPCPDLLNNKYNDYN